MTLSILIASYLEPEYVDRIRHAVPGVEVLYDPSLVAPPRFRGDHIGAPDFQRSPEQEARYRSWLARADVMFDLDRKLAAQLPHLCPRLCWIQGATSGIGPIVEQAGLHETHIQITNAAGIHGVPLAEHVLLCMLYFTKEVPVRRREQMAHRWVRYCGRELRGQTVGVIGLGGAGKEIARVCKLNGLKVLGVKRTASPRPDLHVDELYTQADLPRVLPRCNFLVLICPQSPETEGMIGARELALMPKGAVLINLARGAVVDHTALIDSLRSGHLGGAALDVTTPEPLPPESPLWDMENVFITPHSAACVEAENERLTDLFCENLRRFVEGRPLINLLRL